MLWMMNFRTCSFVFLLAALSGCAAIQRPNAYICGVNLKSSSLRCYNIASDYDDNGTLIPGHGPVTKPFNSIVSGGLYIAPADFSLLKVYIGELRDYYKQNCQLP